MRKFNAIYFDSSNKKKGIKFSIDNGVMELFLNGNELVPIKVQITDMVLSIGGSRNNLIFFKGCGHSFYSELNDQLIKQLKSQEYSNVQDCLKVYTKSKSRKNALYILSFSLFSGFRIV